MYDISLDKERLNLYVASLDSRVKHLATMIQNGNSLLNLKQVLPQLLLLDKEAEYLNKIVDDTDAKSSVVEATTSAKAPIDKAPAAVEASV